MIEIVQATMDHARAIRLREGDLREVEALGETQESAFGKSLKASLWAEAYLIDGEPAVIRGVIPIGSLLSGEVNAWLMSGKPIDAHRKSFMQMTRGGVARLRKSHSLLVSYVHADYARSIAWLRWLGFEIAPASPIGPLNAPFHRATLRGAPS